jgi:hypothetical protein
MSAFRLAALRTAARPMTVAPRVAAMRPAVLPVTRCFSVSRQLRDSHGEETFEEFTARLVEAF